VAATLPQRSERFTPHCTPVATNVASDGGDLSFFFPFKKPLVLFLGWQQMMVMGISYFSTKPELEAPFFSS
jgi:hypothetical protein